jgi:hypothetical protein
MALKLEAISVAEVQPQVTARVEFVNITGAPYYMEPTGDNTRVNSGLSFPFQGGKFSAPIDPEAGRELANRFTGIQLQFSKVVLQVSPASIGRDKKGVLKPLYVLELHIGKELVYKRD